MCYALVRQNEPVSSARCLAAGRRDKLGQASPLNLAQCSEERSFLTGLDDVARTALEGVDRRAPHTTGVDRDLEVEPFTEHVHHDVQIVTAAESGNRARERAAVRIVETRTVQRRSVPHDVREAALVRLATIERRLRQGGMRFPERDHPLKVAKRLCM